MDRHSGENLKWATALVDMVTFGRIERLEEIPDCVKRCGVLCG